jgi:hypothetical protein
MQIELEPPEGLYEKILKRIQFESRRLAKIKFVLFGSSAIISLAGVFFSFQYILQEMSQSGFYNYLSLVFSDTGVVTTYWKEFSLLLAESAPVMGIIFFLGAVLALLGSLKYLYPYEQRFSQFQKI